MRGPKDRQVDHKVAKTAVANTNFLQAPSEMATFTATTRPWN